MKITIEPTEQSTFPNALGAHQPKIIIDYPSDELTASEALVQCARGLVAYGFCASNIAECLSEDIAEEIYLPLSPEEQCCGKSCGCGE